MLYLDVISLEAHLDTPSEPRTRDQFGVRRIDYCNLRNRRFDTASIPLRYRFDTDPVAFRRASVPRLVGISISSVRDPMTKRRCVAQAEP